MEYKVADRIAFPVRPPPQLVIGQLLNRLAELRQELAETKSKLEKAEAFAAAALAAPPPPPATESHGGADHQLALQPPHEGLIRVWVMTHDEGYRLQIDPTAPEGPEWTWTKWSDGTRYTMTDAAGGLGELFDCTCPGCQKHGPRCDQGRGCKHAKFLRALRQLCNPGL